jgi:hypothetical protein|tara:strand:+ start:50 stop:478 length:429 start_codon:yes stop_codon:yes gene_type:complete
VRFTQFTPETNPAAFSNDQQRSVRIVGIRIAAAEVVAQVETSPLVIELVEPHLQDEDGNGVVSVGESAKLIFQLRNRGGLAGRDLRVVATSDDSQVVITDGETLFRDLDIDGHSFGGLTPFPTVSFVDSLVGARESVVSARP